jgi:beta-lactamase regulating signal transducer with metallopeptidase domain
MDGHLVQLLWRNAVLLIPLIILIAGIGKALGLKAPARHALWVGMLLFLALQPVSPTVTLTDVRDVWTFAADPFRDRPADEASKHQHEHVSGGGIPLVVGRPRAAMSTVDAGAQFEPFTEMSSSRTSPRSLTPGVSMMPPSAGRSLTMSSTPAMEGRIAHASADVGAPTQVDVVLGQLAELRDAMLALPQMPVNVWMFGSVSVVLLMGFRIARLRALLAQSTPAPVEVRAMVGRVARSLGIACPDVRMTDHPVTPLVWCGLRPRLILPVGLWGDLEDEARDAVIVHELAHVRRRDHRICWLDLAVACVYWWHPGVWWMRRQIRDDADASCDAWVIALRPRARRAYAQALLNTKSSMNTSGMSLWPAVGLGGSSRHARRLARRITMVMTHQEQPRSARRGVALALAVLAVAYALTPAFACDPNPTPKCDEKKRKACATAPAAPNAPSAPSAPSNPFDEESSDETTFEQYMRELEQQSQRDDLSLDERLQLLEERLAAIQATVERYAEEVGAEAPAARRLHRDLETQVGSARRDLAGFRVRTPGKFKIDVRTGPLGSSSASSKSACDPSCGNGSSVSSGALAVATGQRGPGGPGGPGRPEGVAAFLVADSGSVQSVKPGLVSAGVVPDVGRGGFGMFSQVIEVSSPSKQKMLLTLMERDDVPVIVSGTDTGIVVHGTKEAQVIVGAFVAMIDTDDEGSRTYRFSSPGKHAALQALMERGDVPIYIHRGNGTIRVDGNPLEQEVFGAFVRLIDPN